MSVTIRRPNCRRDCRQTWRHEHGAALPGGPFPGTLAQEGDVRRCEHGRIWYCPKEPSDASNFDQWERLTWWGTPIRYQQARKSLREFDHVLTDHGNRIECSCGQWFNTETAANLHEDQQERS
jgi:hypothetical protein